MTDVAGLGGTDDVAFVRRLVKEVGVAGVPGSSFYSPKELDLMRKLAAVYKQMIPVKGTTNPSGTAPMLARMAVSRTFSSALEQLLELAWSR